jgi:hypothetical protein
MIHKGKRIDTLDCLEIIEFAVTNHVHGIKISNRLGESFSYLIKD